MWMDGLVDDGGGGADPFFASPPDITHYPMTPDSTNLGDLCKFNTETEEWSIMPLRGQMPPPGYGQSLCVYKTRLILFGGTCGSFFYNHLFEFDTVEQVGKWSYTGEGDWVPWMNSWVPGWMDACLPSSPLRLRACLPAARLVLH